jgi:hypothetical protein
MNPYYYSPQRYTQAEAAALALALRQLGQLSAQPSAKAIDRALSVFESRHGYRPELTPELRQAVRLRCGQMFALQLIGTPIPSFGHAQANRAASTLRAA